MQEKPTVGLYHGKRYSSRNHPGKYAVRISVCFQVWKDNSPSYITDYYWKGDNIYLTPEEFKSVESGKAKGTLRDLQDKIFKQRSHASDILDKPMTKQKFESLWVGRIEKNTTLLVWDAFQKVIDKKMKIEKGGAAGYYHNARVSLCDFGGMELELRTCDKKWVKDYEIWGTTKGKKKTNGEASGEGMSLATVSAYLRALRAVQNAEIEQGNLDSSFYAFGKKGHTIRVKRKKKKPVPVHIKDNLVTFKATKPQEQEAVDFALWSFISNGMNFADMAFLEEKQFTETHFSFIRRKTKDTVNEQKEIKVKITKLHREILERRATSGRYIFGKISPDMDFLQKDLAIQQWRKTTNNWLKKIAKKMGYEGPINTMLFRHLFTTLMLEAGVPITKVKDSLGHTMVTTTQDYAEDLDIETTDVEAILIG